MSAPAGCAGGEFKADHPTITPENATATATSRRTTTPAKSAYSAHFSLTRKVLTSGPASDPDLE